MAVEQAGLPIIDRMIAGAHPIPETVSRHVAGRTADMIRAGYLRDDVSKPTSRVQYRGETRGFSMYYVESFERAGVYHPVMVSNNHVMCGCEAGLHGTYCSHADVVWCREHPAAWEARMGFTVEEAAS